MTVGLVVVGLSHHAAALELRERVAFDHARWQQVAPASLPTVLLSTCNRVEVYAWPTERAGAAVRRITRSLARASGMDVSQLAPHLVTRTGRDALLHLVRVAAGLDSLVVGEEQIRGQVRDAVRLADQHDPLPALLRGVFQRTAESARRVRGGTRLGSVPSIASASVHVASRMVPNGLRGKSAVVIGAGVMSRTAVAALLQHGARVTVLNRTPEHARALGMRVRVESLTALEHVLADTDVLVSATASRQAIVHRSTVAAACAHRESPLLILDIAVPRDVEPAVRHISGVTLIDLDDLERECPVDVSVRQAELQRAEVLAGQEADRIAHWLRLRSAGPAIAELRTYGERVRMRELRRSAPRLRDLTPEQIAAVEALTTGIVNKLLHGPTLALRDAAARPSGLSRSRSRILDVLRPSEGRSA